MTDDSHGRVTTLTEPLCFPATAAPGGETTGLVLVPDGDRPPSVAWLGPLPDTVVDDGAGADFADGVAATTGPYAGTPLLIEHSRGSFARPGLRGSRLGVEPIAGRDWSTAFRTTGITCDDRHLLITADDAVAGLQLRTEVESLRGGSLRARHTLTNVGATPYLLDGLDVTVPAPEPAAELLDLTGRHEGESAPQRHPIRDGLWLREGRRGTPGHDRPTLLAAGTTGFDVGSGQVTMVHVAWSGNSVYRAERDAAQAATLGGGELLLPGEVVLGPGSFYTTPWVYVVASSEGLDGVAAGFHTWQRSLPAHPDRQPVTLNVWEAVYFAHDLGTLARLAELAARVGVEQFVLDDGWFRHRRNDRAGLGDWQVDPDVWPDGLAPLVDRVHGLGMRFGLWIEPEMVNPDSDLFRAHPDWILGTGGRRPPLERHQLVLDLTNPRAYDHVLVQLDALLADREVDFVKWDHNRDLLEAGGPTRAGAPAVHEQTTAYLRLLDTLRDRHPRIAWESCAGGGGRIDLAVLERVQRVWPSDNTDALARQHIQRWTTGLIAPEYLGAHVSAPTSHQTGRSLSLDFRAATALFGAFGIEWDLTAATPQELGRLAEWTVVHKRLRPLLHSGRVVRLASSDPAVLLHGVIAADRRSAVIAHVQLDESQHNRGVRIRVPRLLPGVSYRARWEGPVVAEPLTGVSRSPGLHPDGPTRGTPASAAVLADVGLWIPRRQPESITLIHLGADE